MWCIAISRFATSKNADLTYTPNRGELHPFFGGSLLNLVVIFEAMLRAMFLKNSYH